MWFNKQKRIKCDLKGLSPVQYRAQYLVNKLSNFVVNHTQAV
ncbi:MULTISPECIES: IS3 family transposase [Mannheimia]|nr:IS3 family transposase [Mannheimia pernigra]QLB44195.1 IS3 family transposase [Mannheimia pernigra]